MINEVNKNNKNINNKQNKQIAALQRKFASLKAIANLPKKTRKRVQKRALVSRTSHPLMNQVKALVSPFNAIPGAPQHLVDSLPSHKLTLRSRTSVSVAAAASLFGGLSPYIWNNDPTNTPSGFYVTAGGDGSTGGVWTPSIFNSSVTGTSPAPSGATSYGTLTPVRPYSTTGDSYTARLVSYGFRVRYTGTALNANGSFKILATPHGELDMSSLNTTYRKVIDTLQGSHSTQMKSIYDKAVYEFNFIGNSDWSTTGSGADLDGSNNAERVGQASSSMTMAEWGCVFFYSNNSSSAVQFELELIEHWEVRAPNLVPFYTDSHSNPELHHEIMNIVNTAHVRAGLQSEKKLASVVQDVARASKSPLGKVVLAAALG